MTERARHEFKRIGLRRHSAQNAALLALFILCASARAVADEGFTIPPAPNHYVTDNVGAMSPGARAKVENTLRAYERDTGHQVIVYIDQTTGDIPLEMYTTEIAHHWRIGRRGYDDGAVFFLFMRDHRIRIEVGYGLEGRLTDADSSRIIRDEIAPQMKAGNVDGAVTDGVAAMLTTITPGYSTAMLALPTPVPISASTLRWMARMFIAILFFMFFFFIAPIILVSWRRPGHLGIWSSSFGGGGNGGSSDDGGGFSAGGGDFGGGGASGSW